MVIKDLEEMLCGVFCTFWSGGKQRNVLPLEGHLTRENPNFKDYVSAYFIVSVIDYLVPRNNS